MKVADHNPGAAQSEPEAIPVKILIATRNLGKLSEFRALFEPLRGLALLSLRDLGPLPEVVEDGESFEQNARKKALQTATASRLAVMADDSGLEVDALGGSPGVRSARFAGPRATDEENNRKLLGLLRDVPDAERGARFRCVLALAVPAGREATLVRVEQGVFEGRILRKPRGSNGFGYDPVFLPDGSELSLAELSDREKNRISHRAQAAFRIRDFLGGFLAQRVG